MDEVRYIIVRRGHFATYELLSRSFADDPRVKIIWDRRMGERRQPGDVTGEGERRARSDRRRVPPPEWSQLHYMLADDGLPA
ncbi:MAG TPA: hypothetical protein VJM31_06305 [Vicinamibacterales bacterium]|nr:hypothetical protein [Vicinamibacterales bacterium]